MAGRLERGEVRLYRFSAPDKERPVLILTRGSSIPHLSRVTIVPITSTVRGVASEVMLGVEDGMRQPCAANFHNIMTVAQAGIGRRLTQLGPSRLREVCAALAFALGCDS